MEDIKQDMKQKPLGESDWTSRRPGRVLARRVFLWRVLHGGYETGGTIIINILHARI